MCTETETLKQRRSQTPAVLTNRSPIVYFRWQRNLEEQLPIAMFLLSIVYRLHQGAQSFLGTRLIATMVAALTGGVGGP